MTRSLTALLLLAAASIAWTPPYSMPNAAPAEDEQDSAELGPAYGDARLSTYIDTPALKSALSELQAGRPESALTFLPAKPHDLASRWIKALALRAADQPRPARAIFEELAAQGGPLADRALHNAGLCAVDEGNGAAAEKLLAQVPARYVDADQAMLERARQVMGLRVAGPSTAKRVEEILQPIFDGQVPKADLGAAHLVAGDAQLAAGAREAARAHYRAAWVDRPLSGAAESARQRERQLGPGTPVPPAALLKRAEILLDAHRNREALDQLARIPAPPLCEGGCTGDHTPAGLLKAALGALGAFPEQHVPTPDDVARAPDQPADALACRIKLDQGRALRKEHEYARARTALAPVILRCADSDVRTRALYILATLETIGGRPSGPLWESLARRYPQSTLADDALFNQSLAARRAGDREAERALLRDLIDNHLDSDLRSEAIFRLFWSFWTQGDGRQGLALLDQLAAHPDPDGAEEERARYWRARVLLMPAPDASELARAAEREAAREDLVWLVQERPLTYHGLLARGRLGELDPQRAQRIDDEQDRRLTEELKTRHALHAGSLARDPHLLAAVELLKLGLKQEAARELTAVDRAPARALVETEAGQEPLTLLADLFARAGDFRNAHALVRTDLRMLLRHPSGPLAFRAASLAYPLAFRERIAQVSKAAAIPPDLLQALMREESALDPRALSSTGALGLTQVMPATARALAHKLRIKGYQTSSLYDPDVNIRIGGSYLGELYARFQHPALALAGYNAGPGAVSGWMKARGGLPLDAWVEEIPLDETRGYVKRCLRSFAAYQYLYSNGRLPAVGQAISLR